MFIYIFFTYLPNQYFIYCLAIDEPKVPIFDGFPFCVYVYGLALSRENYIFSEMVKKDVAINAEG